MSELNPHLEVTAEWTRAGLRRRIPFADLAESFGPAFTKVDELISAEGVDIIGPAYACYYGMPTDVVDVEVGFGVDQPFPSTELDVTSVPLGEAVVATHYGPYTQLEDSYHELMPWLESQVLELADHMYEFYDTMPDSGDGAITRLVFPLA